MIVLTLLTVLGVWVELVSFVTSLIGFYSQLISFGFSCQTG